MEKISNNENALRKQILELGPLVLFFIGNYFFGILWGTGILVFATLISISTSWFIDKKIPLMASFGCAAVVFFGVLTLIFDRDVALQTGSDVGVFLFIKIKPTVVSLLIGLSLIATDLLGYNPLKSIMSSGLKLSPKGWKILTRLWVVMFISMALANELAWRNLTTDDWVSFKAFGIPILSIVFAVFSIPVIRKYDIDKD
jgi:intracellular septation protein